MKHPKLVGAVSNCAVSTDHGIYAVRLETAPTGRRKCPFIFRIHYKSDIENLGNRIDDRLDRIESLLDKQSTRIENLNQNYINHLQAHDKQSK